MNFTKKLCFVVAIIICAMSFCACEGENIITETFSYENFSMKLPIYFEEQDLENYNFYYTNNDIEIVLGNIESKEMLTANGIEVDSLYDYANLIKQIYSLNEEIQQNEDYYYIVYERTIAEISYKYVSCFFENETGTEFLNVCYLTAKAVFNIDLALTYMDSVQFN